MLEHLIVSHRERCGVEKRRGGHLVLIKSALELELALNLVAPVALFALFGEHDREFLCIDLSLSTTACSNQCIKKICIRIDIK